MAKSPRVHDCQCHNLWFFGGCFSPFCEKYFHNKIFCYKIHCFEKKSSKKGKQNSKNSPKNATIAYHIKGCLRFYTFHNIKNRPIWLNTCMYYHHLSNITKLKKKNTHTHTHTHTLFCYSNMNILSYYSNRQIWLNILMDYRHFSNIRKLQKNRPVDLNNILKKKKKKGFTT